MSRREGPLMSSLRMSITGQEKSPIKKPRKVIKPDGKMARQMLMGMALGCHVMEQVFWNVYFTIKSRVEAQILFVIMGPFLAVPLAFLLIPMICMGIVGMITAGITSNMERFTHLQTVMDRRQFNLVKRQSTMNLKRASTLNLMSNNNNETSMFSRIRLASQKTSPPPPRATSSMTPLAPRPRTGRRTPTRSQTFTFGGSAQTRRA